MATMATVNLPCFKRVWSQWGCLSEWTSLLGIRLIWACQANDHNQCLQASALASQLFRTIQQLDANMDCSNCMRSFLTGIVFYSLVTFIAILARRDWHGQVTARAWWARLAHIQGPMPRAWSQGERDADFDFLGAGRGCIKHHATQCPFVPYHPNIIQKSSKNHPKIIQNPHYDGLRIVSSTRSNIRQFSGAWMPAAMERCWRVTGTICTKCWKMPFVLQEISRGWDNSLLKDVSKMFDAW